MGKCTLFPDIPPVLLALRRRLPVTSACIGKHKTARRFCFDHVKGNNQFLEVIVQIQFQWQRLDMSFRR